MWRETGAAPCRTAAVSTCFPPACCTDRLAAVRPALCLSPPRHLSYSLGCLCLTALPACLPAAAQEGYRVLHHSGRQAAAASLGAAAPRAQAHPAAG